MSLSMLAAFNRFLQLLAAATVFSLLLVFGMFGFFIYGYLVYASVVLRYPLLVYGAWILFDWKAAVRGHRRSRWLRNWPLWRCLRDYFPCRLHKTAELPPDRNYLLVAFPHGVLSTGVFCAVSTDACGFSQLFPGLAPSVMTLWFHYLTPFVRELALALGARVWSYLAVNG